MYLPPKGVPANSEATAKEGQNKPAIAVVLPPA